MANHPICQSINEQLSAHVDGLLNGSEANQVASHLIECSACTALVGQLSEMRMAARDLPVHTPPRALWTRISNAIELEANAVPVRSEDRITVPLAKEESFWNRLKAAFSLPQMVGAGALAAMVVAFGTMTVYRQINPNATMNGMQSAFVIEEGQLKSELDKKMTAVRTRIANWDAQKRSSFESNLTRIETGIEQCRQQLQANPADQQQQQTMRRLYQEKRQLLEQVEQAK